MLALAGRCSTACSTTCGTSVGSTCGGGRPGAARDPPSIDPDAVAILAILAEGRTLGDAASTLGLSRRTADRRLAEAREAFGVERTVEAVSRARRLGLLGLAPELMGRRKIR